MTDVPAPPTTPDTKDWTWVLERSCPECGFDPATIGREDVAPAIRDNAAFWARVGDATDAEVRPEPATWSATEYACHVRDVHRIFAERARLMLTQDDPLFADWDQDEAARADRYDQQSATAVVPDLVEEAEAAAATYDGVVGTQWERPGRRSNGSVFTVETLGRYHLHDVVHHRWDLRALEESLER